MTIGIGTDIIEIDRVGKAFANERLLRKCFTPREIEHLGNSAHRLAGNFAGKESVAKALGTGFSSFGLIDIEILRDELGRPFVILRNNAKAVAQELGVINFQLSISHCKVYAVAFAVAEGGSSFNENCVNKANDESGEACD